MEQDEIANLIKFSPANLLDLFDDTMMVHEANIPPYGKIRDEPVTFRMTPNQLLTPDDIEQMLVIDVPESEKYPIEFKTIKFKYNF